MSSGLHARVRESDALLRTALGERSYGDLAVVSSFGAESAVLLHMVAAVDTATPVLFIDTRMLFQETLDYKSELIRALDLRDVRTVSPEGQVIRQRDPWGRMHLSDPDACCDFRKTSVLHAALASFDGWITGRKRFQAFTRDGLKTIERQAKGKTKINPLADWTERELAEYAECLDLPQHPLVSQGYPSIGCASCTSRVVEGEHARAGRWRDTEKVECGIHFENGKLVRTGAARND